MMQIHDYSLFNSNVSTLKNTSVDDDNSLCMTNSLLTAINFDEVKKAYSRNLRLADYPKSNDALLFLANDEFVFVEFKNCYISPKIAFEVQWKMLDSSIIFADIVCHKISFLRNKVDYVLVYNAEKNQGETKEKTLDDLQPSRSRFVIQKEFLNKAKQDLVRFGLERYKGYCYRNIYTMTLSEFEEDFLVDLQLKT